LDQQSTPRRNPANDEQLKIGVRLKHARKVKGLRLRQLAERVGCSESFLSKIENNKVNPSLQMLHRIVTELDITIGKILSQDMDEGKVVTRSGERPTIHMVPSRKTEGIHIEWLIPPGDSRLLSGSVHVVHPGGGSLGTIEHEGEEVGFLLEGELELEVEGKTYNLREGDSFFFRSDLPHGYRNTSDNITRIIWINTPPTF
jgi:transcriptional regulator with XRE-family HTH domain